ncbi:MAG TPA: mannosyltransferase family protein [Actinomycetota bacterium]
MKTEPKAPVGAATVGRHRRAPAGGVHRTGGLREAALYCAKVFLGVRVLMWVVALVAVAVFPHAPAGGFDSKILGHIPGPVSVPGWPAHAIAPGWQNLFTAWERFDALWYLRIAAHGYASHDGSAAFYPLFPLTVRAVSFVIGGHPLAAGLLVANGAFLGALIALYLLTSDELGEETARGSVLFAAVFPTAFFFVSPYSESLFLMLAVVTLWTARRGRWEVAGLAGALAALTRNVGVLLVLPLVVEAVHQALERRPWRWPVKPLAWSLAPAAGAGVYLLYWRARVGDWLAPIHQQAGWERKLANPGFTLLEGTRDAYRFIGIYPGGYHLLDWVVTIPVLALAVWTSVRLRPAYAVYVWASILAPLSFIFTSRPLMSFPRFALPLFPIFWGAARLTEGRRVRRELAVAASATMLGVLLLLFVAWYYVF